MALKAYNSQGGVASRSLIQEPILEQDGWIDVVRPRQYSVNFQKK